MTVTTVIEIAGAILLSLGGAGAIVIAAASWLGKVWANRILSLTGEGTAKNSNGSEVTWRRRIDCCRPNLIKQSTSIASNSRRSSAFSPTSGRS